MTSSLLAEYLHILDKDQDEIDDMHILTSAQRENLDADAADDIDGEKLKQSINRVAGINPEAERTGSAHDGVGEQGREHEHEVRAACPPAP